MNLHAWIAYELRQDFKYYPDPVGNPNTFTIPSHWSFLFGPSISIGNVGANL